MTWLTWRLHRNEAVIGILLFAGLIATMYFGMRSIDIAFDAANESNCFGAGASNSCTEKLDEYFNRLGAWDNRLTSLLHGVPIAVAALVAIPTLHELERGSFRLAWIQSISRRRWVITRLGFLVAVTAVVTAIWMYFAAEWRHSVMQTDAKSFSYNAFSLSPVVLIGYGLFALALVLAAGVVFRRLVPAIGFLVLAFTGARIFTTFVLRERYRDPVEVTGTDPSSVGKLIGLQDYWSLDSGWLDRQGKQISWNEMNKLCDGIENGVYSDRAYEQCISDNGLQFFTTYHPIDRFGQFQAIETLLFAGLAAVLLTFAYLWLTRRSA
jgi:hypothetical protein